MNDQRALYPAESEPGRSEIHLADIARGLYRSRWLIGAVVVVIVAVAAVYTLLQKPEYESEASVQIHIERAARYGALSDLGAAIGLTGLASQEASRIGTDILVMQSRRIIEHVADSLHLHVQLADPRVPRGSIFSAIAAPREVIPATVDLRHRGNGIYAVSIETASVEPLQYDERAEIGKPFMVGNVALTLDAALRDSLPDGARVDIRNFRKTVEGVQSRLTVELAAGGAQIILVRYRTHDPVLAAAVSNGITDGFIRHRNLTSKAESRSRAEFLRQQVANYRVALANAEADLQTFREREQIINAPAQATEQVRRFAELMTQRDALQQESDALRRLLARLRTESLPDSAQETYRQLAAFPVFFVNSAIQDIIRSLIDLENQRAQLLVQRTPESIDVRGIDTRIAQLELQLLETSENYLESRENQMASLDATLSQFTGIVGTVPAREVELARLTREQELLTSTYGQLQTRLHEVELEEAVEPLDVQLLDPALVPDLPVSPRPILNLILAVFLGTALGLLVAFGRQVVDTKVRSRNDVRLASGGLPVMATIPRIAPDLDRRRNGRTLRRLRLARAEFAPGGSPLVVRDAPRSAAAEAYRALRTRVFFRPGTDAPRILVVTSAAAGEGKSTSAANLAVTLAQQGVTTLLIDGDLRKGILHELFGVERLPGLCEVLRDQIAPDAVVRSIPLTDGALDIIASGEHPANPAELIGSQRMQHLLTGLLDRYDRILIDTPPLRFATDAAILCSMPSAGTMLVARAGFSDRHAIEDVAHELHEMGIRLDGVVINDVAAAEAPAYGYHASAYAD